MAEITAKPEVGALKYRKGPKSAEAKKAKTQAELNAIYKAVDAKKGTKKVKKGAKRGPKPKGKTKDTGTILSNAIESAMEAIEAKTAKFKASLMKKLEAKIAKL